MLIFCSSICFFAHAMEWQQDDYFDQKKVLQTKISPKTKCITSLHMVLNALQKNSLLEMKDTKKLRTKIKHCYQATQLLNLIEFESTKNKSQTTKVLQPFVKLRDDGRKPPYNKTS